MMAQRIVRGMPKSEYNKQWSKENTVGSFDKKLRSLLYSAKMRAKNKGFEFSVTAEDFEPIYFCPLLPSIKFSFNNGPGHERDTSMSLDRIDPTKGYTKENTWIISYRANRIKSNATIEEFEKMALIWRRKLGKDT